MYLWLKALHLIAMVAWFAGLFYMFRLFVNQVENRESPDACALLAGMADRLYRIIMTPAMLATLAFGVLMLVSNPELLRQGWLQTKLLLVLGLLSYHLFTGRVRRHFAAGRFFLSSRQCRLLNEVPTLFLITIVLLAVLRPF